MNRKQRRDFEKSEKKQKNEHSRMVTLNGIASNLNSIGRPSFLFDKNMIANDRRLYLLYNLPNDEVMRAVVMSLLDEFEIGLYQEGQISETEVVKLDMFMTVFDSYFKDGTLNSLYERACKKRA